MTPANYIEALTKRILGIPARPPIVLSQDVIGYYGDLSDSAGITYDKETGRCEEYCAACNNSE